MTAAGDDDLPDSLTMDEAFRAAFYMILQYLEIEKYRSEDIVLLAQYMWGDPARWNDWKAAVRRALGDGGLANPNREGHWEGPREWPSPPGA